MTTPAFSQYQAKSGRLIVSMSRVGRTLLISNELKRMLWALYPGVIKPRDVIYEDKPRDLSLIRISRRFRKGFNPSR
jgi:hypothetical protein